MIRQGQPELSEETKIAIQFARESSVRARTIVLLLVTLSVLTFLAWWNHYEHAWPRTRLRTAQLAVYALCIDADTALRAKGSASPLDKDCDLDKASHYFPTDKELRRGRAHAERQKYTLTQAKAHLQNLQQQYVAGVTKLTIPFLGVQADVNDLGIFGGITFVVLLSLFCYCIWREEQNVAQLFMIARQRGELAVAYYLFAMTQVFTIPPHERGNNTFVNKATSRAIYWLPVLVLGLVSWYDIWITWKYQDEFTTALDWVTIGVEGVVFITIMVQRRLVGKVADQLDFHWCAAYQEIVGSSKSSVEQSEQSDCPRNAATEDQARRESGGPG